MIIPDDERKKVLGTQESNNYSYEGLRVTDNANCYNYNNHNSKLRSTLES